MVFLTTLAAVMTFIIFELMSGLIKIGVAGNLAENPFKELFLHLFNTDSQNVLQKAETHYIGCS